jgi:predicted NBD/HSP70 family sugar kinase
MTTSRHRLNPALIRRLNVARVFHALRLAGGASQAELARATGLDPATVSSVVSSLRADGWVRSDRGPAEGRSGRPPTLLTIDPHAGLLVGARLEPGLVRVLATSLAGIPRGTWQGTAGPSVEDAVVALTRGLDELLHDVEAEWGDIKAVGVGVPALMALDGRVAHGPNLRWSDVPLQAYLTQRWSLPVAVDNDTSAAALAEKLFGAAQEARDFVVIAGHSGVGGALYLGGRLHRGAGGFAGEIGHVRVVPGGRRCSCGDHGCLEAYLSERGLEAELRARRRRVRGYEAIAEAAARGDETVRAVLDDAGTLLGRVVADLVDLLDPELLVLAGSLCHVAPWLLPAIERVKQDESLGTFRGRCRVVTSRFGPDAVTMGGVGLAMEAVLSLPSWLIDQEVVPAWMADRSAVVSAAPATSPSAAAPTRDAPPPGAQPARRRRR